MVYAEFGGQTECIMGNWKIENFQNVFSLRKDPFATATYTSPRHRRPLYQDLSTPQDWALKKPLSIRQSGGKEI